MSVLQSPTILEKLVLFKLLKWYGILYNNINRFSAEKIAMMANDTLIKIYYIK